MARHECFAAAALLCALAAQACGSGPPSVPQPARGAHSPAAVPAERPASPAPSGPPRLARIEDLTPDERLWGLRPTPHAEVTYQPDVVMLEEGPAAIRGVSANGLEWTIDATATRADEIEPGKVLFATSRVAGRVLGVRKQAGSLVVVLGPAELTDFIRDADIAFDTPVDFSQAQQFEAPNLPGAASEAAPLEVEASANGWSLGASRPYLVALRHSPTFGFVRPVADVKVGGFRVSPVVSLSGIGGEVVWDSAGLSFNGVSTLRLEKPRLSFVLKIEGGRIVRCELELMGAVGMAMQFSAISATGLPSNINKTLHVPSDFSIPLLGEVVPFSVTVRQAYVVKTGFGAKGRLQASGDYALNGGFSVGYNNGTLGVGGPSGLTAKESLVDSIQGISATPSGIVLTQQTRVIVGIGTLGFVTGPFFSLTTTMGIIRHSDLDTLARCKAATFIVHLDAGIGYFMPRVLTDGINVVLRALNLGQIKGEGGVTLLQPEKIINAHSFAPRSKACGA